MTSFNQGDVVLVPLPFTDLSAVKQWPGASSFAEKIKQRAHRSHSCSDYLSNS